MTTATVVREAPLIKSLNRHLDYCQLTLTLFRAPRFANCLREVKASPRTPRLVGARFGVSPWPSLTKLTCTIHHFHPF